MEKKDIEHLGTLARIALSDDEKASLAEDITEILGYVDAVQEIAASEKEKRADGLFNVVRADEPTHAPGAYTDALLSAAPDRQGRYVRVKKILGNE